MLEQRRIVTRSGRGMRGYYPSIKTQKMVAWESPLERDACLLFDFLPTISAFTEYQMLEVYYDGTAAKKCYPDYSIEFSNGVSCLVEIKPASKLKDLNIKKKYALIAESFARQKRPFRIVTDTEIRREPRFSNLQFLSYHRPRYGTAIKRPTKNLLQQCCGKTLREAAQIVGDRREIFRWLSVGILCIADDEPINDATKLLISKEAENGSFQF
jgi:hypothetical protein